MRGPLSPVRLWIAAIASFALALAGTDAPPPQHIQEGALDDIVLHAAAVPPLGPVVIRLFPADQAVLGTGAEGGKDTRVAAAKTMQTTGPKLLADAFVAELKKLGPYADVRLDDGGTIPMNALVIEGEFTQLDPGSRAKRYWGGFGAGKSGTEVKGRVTTAAGDLLAEFRQKRIAVMGFFGGDYESKMRSDCKSIGEDIASFLSKWAKRKRLTDD